MLEGKRVSRLQAFSQSRMLRYEPRGAVGLGFIFAQAASPAEVERALRQAHGLLSFEIT